MSSPGAKNADRSKSGSRLLNDCLFVLMFESSAQGLGDLPLCHRLCILRHLLQFIEAGCVFTNVSEGLRRFMMFATGCQRCETIGARGTRCVGDFGKSRCTAVSKAAMRSVPQFIFIVRRCPCRLRRTSCAKAESREWGLVSTGIFIFVRGGPGR